MSQIDWNGGECTVSLSTKVRISLREAEPDEQPKGDEFGPDCWEIVVYEIVDDETPVWEDE